MNLIQKALAQGHHTLNEFASKQFLAAYGIPVSREALVRTEAEAVAAAERIGYPVALKACSARLPHKSEAGAVALHLEGPEAVRREMGRVARAVHVPLDGFLIQEMVAGQRELVAGLSRDPQFGPCVMLGLGGVMAEVFRDTAFRVAPFDRAEALDMIGELRSRALLGAFRGQAPADPQVLVRILLALGRIGLENDRIAEIDINPIIVTPSGAATAVDALIVLQEK